MRSDDHRFGLTTSVPEGQSLRFAQSLHGYKRKRPRVATTIAVLGLLLIGLALLSVLLVPVLLA